MKKTILSIFTFVTLTATTQITNVSLISDQATVTVGGNTNITTSGSQIGYNYLLRNNSDNSLVSFPQLGTGSSLVFNTGSISTSTTYNLLVSNAITLQFNNNFSSIQLGNDTRTIEQEVTTAAWVKTSGTFGLLRNIVHQYGAGDAGYILRLAANGRAYMSGREQTNSYRTSGESTTVVTDNQWHYIVGTINLNTGVWSVYVDGVLESTQTYPAGVSLETSSANLLIGGTFSTSRSIIGDVRDVTIWNRALNAPEVTTNFSSCITGSEANVVGHFPLNEGQGSNILDYSIIGIDGTNNVGNSPYPWIDEYTSCRDSLLISQLITVNVSTDILVNSITVQGQGSISTIATDLGTLQMEATVLPTNALDASYTWSVNDGTGSATIDANGLLSAVNNGTVEVKATANDGSGTTGTAIITISSQTAGIEENVNSKITIYPNPVQNQLFIEFNDAKIKRIEIVDISGKTCQFFNQKVNSIDVSNFAPGIYFTQIITEKGMITKRFLKY